MPKVGNFFLRDGLKLKYCISKVSKIVSKCEILILQTVPYSNIFELPLSPFYCAGVVGSNPTLPNTL